MKGKIGLAAMLLSSSAFGAIPSFYCSQYEITDIMKQETVESALVGSGRIQSVSVTDGGYMIATKICKIEVFLDYNDSNGNGSCPAYTLRFGQPSCGSL